MKSETIKNQVVVTSGKKYLDIDAYGAIFSYRTLLRSLGYEAYAMSTAKINESVPSVIRELGFTFDSVNIDDDTEFIILDVSNPKFFDTFVVEPSIKEIIDHHTGFEDYWNECGVTNHIEFIGSVCTIIAERFFEKNEENLLTPELCKLLTAGILDNTLNFQTENTTERDRDVYRRLLQIGQLEGTWKRTYFSSCYAEAAGRLEESLKESVKIEKVSSLLPEIFAQMIFPNEECILDNLSKIKSSLREYDEWILNAISLEEEKSLIICSSQAVRDKVNGLFEDAEIHEFGLTLPRSILRKEIMKRACEMIL